MNQLGSEERLKLTKVTLNFQFKNKKICLFFQHPVFYHPPSTLTSPALFVTFKSHHQLPLLFLTFTKALDIALLLHASMITTNAQYII